MAKAFISGVGAVELQEKVVDITKNGTVEILPDPGKFLSKVTAKVKAGGHEYTEGLAYTYDEYGKCYEVGRGDWEGAEELRIPSTYDDGVNGELPVKGLAYGAFQNMTMIKRVYADSLTYSRGSSFYGCSLDFLSIKGYKMTASFEFSSSGVKEVIFGDITYIDWGTFGGCSPTCRFDFSECTQIPSLDSEDALGELTAGAQIVVPAHLKEEWKQATNWTLYADYIVVKGQENAQEKTIDITENGSYEVVPDEGKLLSKVVANVNVGGGGDSASIDALIEGSITEISSDVTAIRINAFNFCEALTSANLPHATSIGNSAFRNCEALKSANIPNATSIGTYVFGDCTALESALLPNAISIGDYAFQGCAKLESVSFPNATSIGQYAFAECVALASVNAPNVTSIAQYTFRKCALTSANFPNAISIGSAAFRECAKLESVSFPKVTSIVGYAFYSCKKCLEYDFSGCTAVPTLSNINAFQDINSNAKIKVPAALYDEWITATNWTNYAKYIVAI